LINTPSNPLGTVIPAKVLQEIYEMASKHNLWIVSDECYDQITFEQPMASIGANDPEERVISTYSFSKSYAMTGWRVGYAITPKRISGDIAKLQEPLISCVSSPAQFAALAALQGPQECIQEMRDAYRERRDAAAEVAKAANLDFIMPAGAFYFWLGIKETKMPSLDFVLKLVREHAIATAHGSAFGNFGEGYVRVSLANTKESILKGVTAIANQHAQLIQHN
jgi:aspartate aminotransferase